MHYYSTAVTIWVFMCMCDCVSSNLDKNTTLLNWSVWLFFFSSCSILVIIFFFIFNFVVAPSLFIKYSLHFLYTTRHIIRQIEIVILNMHPLLASPFPLCISPFLKCLLLIRVSKFIYHEICKKTLNNSNVRNSILTNGVTHKTRTYTIHRTNKKIHFPRINNHLFGQKNNNALNWYDITFIVIQKQLKTIFRKVSIVFSKLNGNEMLFI